MGTLRRSAAAALAATAVVHLVVAPEHLHEQWSLGALFLVAGLASLAIAAWLWLTDGVRPWAATTTLSMAMAGAYFTSRTSGLLGHHPEPIDPLGLATTATELAVVVVGMSTLRRCRPTRGLLTLALATTTSGMGLLPIATTAGATATPPPPFQLPLPVPPTLKPVMSDATTDYYKIAAKVGQVQMLPGMPRTKVLTYNGFSPGPTIRQRAGRFAKVTLVNNLSEETNIHLHGAHVQPSSDGAPQDLVAPGTSRKYSFPNKQTARTMWYHDHAMDLTGPHVYKGLAGVYLLSDAAEESLNLPKGANDVPLVIQDRLFNEDASLSYPLTSSHADILGDTIVVNGAAQPYFAVPATKVRFRILNGSNARQYRLALSNSQPLVQVGSEGGLLSKPVSQSSMTLGPAERADVVVDFSNLAIGTRVVLQNLNGSGSTAEVMRFDVARTDTDSSEVPDTLRSLPSPSDATTTRTFTLSKLQGTWVINGKGYDPGRVDATPAFGTTEIWKFTNATAQAHVMHLHDVNFRILDIGGQPPPPGRDAMTEMVNVPGGSSASVIVTFNGYKGTYVFHCHVLEHEDHRMMSQFKVA